MSLTNPHDRFFKHTLAEPEATRDFLTYYLPAEIASALDLDNVERVNASFVDAELTEHLADLLYRVKRKGGGSAFVYFLLEHKSAPEPDTPLQLLRYLSRAHEYVKAQKLESSPIVPVVLYHGVVPWRVPWSFREFLGIPADDPLAKHQVDFEYHLCDLSEYTDEELKGGVLVQMCLLTLKYIHRDELRDRLPQIFGLAAQLLTQETGLQYVEALLRYVCAGTDRLGAEELREVLDQTLSEEGGTLMPTIAEQWIQEGEQRGEKRGLQRGLQRGRQEGEQRGEQRGLLNGIALALELRFGEHGLQLLPEIEERADVSTLKALMEAVKQATSPEDLRRVYAGG